MKLRIKGNSLRLRLTQSEVAAIEKGDTVSETMRIAIDSELEYRLEPWELNVAEVRLANQSLRIFIPKQWVTGWLASDRTGFDASIDNGTGTPLTLLIEKDFNCLTPRQGEDESDHFPHPGADQHKC